MIIAAMGASTTSRMVPMMPPPLLRLPPPKKRPNWAMVEMAPAMVAVIVIVSVSWFLMWASSCAITPASSS